MDGELRNLEERVWRLEAAVGRVRDQLLGCVRSADLPQQSMMSARTVLEGLTRDIVEALNRARGEPDAEVPATIFARVEWMETEGSGLVPPEVVTLLHMVRVIGNKAAHDDLQIEPGPGDVSLLLSAILRVVEWYFGEFKLGPRVNPLYSGSASLPWVDTAVPPPEVRAPPLVVSGRGAAGGSGAGAAAEGPRRVFVFTERILGFGREKTHRDPRVHVVARLLPCPPGHPNFNLTLQAVSRFHAQVRWQLGHAEVRDEASDKGVILNGERIAPGVWTRCSFADPAVVSLGPGGVSFLVREVIRDVDGTQVPHLRLVRTGNWPHHEVLLLSRPLFTIGGPAAVAGFKDVEGTVATVRMTERGWLCEPAGAEPFPVEPGATCPVAGSGLTVKRLEEEDFLS